MQHPPAMKVPNPNCRVVVMSYPGRGHINPMLNLCRLILNSQPHIHITFIVTEEWFGLLGGGGSTSANFKFGTIPNVIPSEIGRGKDFPGFYEATLTKLQAPVEELLDRLELEPSVIIYDTYLSWVVGLGKRRNIPVASFYPMSATVFAVFHHFDLLVENRHFGSDLTDQEKKQLVSYIPGVASMRITDLPTPVYGEGQKVLQRALEAVKLASEAQYLLISSVYELESQVHDALREKLPAKIYPLGLTIPYFDTENSSPGLEGKPEYLKWLDTQPVGSVLYISQGSFLSVSSDQLDEIIAGIRASGVRFLWVARGEAGRLIENGSGNGLVVSWCDQLKVLCHPSVGGFWSHCGWNSTKEAAFAGVPVLTFPIFWDQVTNSRLIVEEWKIGLPVKKDDESLVTAKEIARLVARLMDPEGDEATEMRRRAKEIKEICRNASAAGGSAEFNISAFLSDILGQ